jgi:hypothetical protein
MSCIISYGQSYLGETRNRIKNKIESFYDSNYIVNISESIVRIDTFYTSNDDFDHFDTIANINLQIGRIGVEKIGIKYLFGRTYSNYCDSIIFEYTCSKCVNNHINDLLSEQRRKWKQVGIDNYISRKWIRKETDELGTTYGIPQLTINRTPDKPVCVTAIFSLVMMEKKKWKQLTK